MPFYLLVRLILHLVASDGGSTKPRHEVCTDSLQCAVEVSGSGFDSGYAICGIFSLLRRRLGRCYRRNAGPHVALAQTQVREHTPFEEKNRRKCRIAAQLWRFFWPARSPACSL